MWQYDYLQASFRCFISIVLLLCFIAYNLSSSSPSQAGSLFTNEEQKKGDSWPIWYDCHTCQPCLWCHWYRLLGTKRQHSWSCFQDFQTLNLIELYWHGSCLCVCTVCCQDLIILILHVWTSKHTKMESRLTYGTRPTATTKCTSK